MVGGFLITCPQVQPSRICAGHPRPAPHILTGAVLIEYLICDLRAPNGGVKCVAMSIVLIIIQSAYPSEIAATLGLQAKFLATGKASNCRTARHFSDAS